MEYFSLQAPKGEEGMYLGFSHLHSFLSSIFGFGNIHKKGNNQTLVFFFLSMKSVIFAKISKAIAATKPIAAK